MLITSIVLPFIARSTSPGRMAVPEGMFSAVGMSAVTFMRGLSLPTAHIVAIIAAPPDMSPFIASIPAAGLIEMPPESNVIPLPIRAIPLSALLPPRYLRMMKRGGFVEPEPTPRTPPIPNLASCFSLSTSHSRPTSVASACARSASFAGGSSFAGSFAMSRVWFAARPSTIPRSTPRRTAFSFDLSCSTIVSVAISLGSSPLELSL